jgi:hypothetical protein
MSVVPVWQLVKVRTRDQASSDCRIGGSGEEREKRNRHPWTGQGDYATETNEGLEQ